MSLYFYIEMKRFFFIPIIFMMLPLFVACAETEEEEEQRYYYIDDNNAFTPERQLLRERYQGKKISILGNSRCTFKGYIPSSNRCYYPKGNVDDVSKTWWWMVINTIGAYLEVNNSYSAGRITNTHPSYPNDLSRIENLGNPDCIFLWGGVNDQNNGVDVGTIDFSLPDEDLDESKFAPALILLIRSLKSLYMESQIVLFVEDDLGEEYSKTMFDIASYFGLKTIDLSHLRTSKFDALHYNANGMIQVANETIKQLMAE